MEHLLQKLYFSLASLQFRAQNTMLFMYNESAISTFENLCTLWIESYAVTVKPRASNEIKL